MASMNEFTQIKLNQILAPFELNGKPYGFKFDDMSIEDDCERNNLICQLKLLLKSSHWVDNESIMFAAVFSFQ